MKKIIKLVIVSFVCIILVACSRNAGGVVVETPAPEVVATPSPEVKETPTVESEKTSEIDISEEPIMPTPSPSPRPIIGDKWQTLTEIMNEAHEAKNLVDRAALQEEWLYIALSATEGVQDEELDGYDTLCLSKLGDILVYSPNFIWADELFEEDLIDVIVLYFNTIYYRAFSYIVNDREQDFPEIMYDRDDGKYVVEAETANRLFNNLLGVDYPEEYGDYTDKHGNCDRRDGTFYISPRDYETPRYYLSGYRYLGGSLYLVAFDVAYRDLEESGDFKIVQDVTILLVQKNDSLWGFTVVSKLKGLGYWCEDIDLPALKKINWVRIERTDVP